MPEKDVLSEPDSNWKQTKIHLIKAALEEETVDVNRLKDFCVSKGGLITDDLRKRVWPLLLNASKKNEKRDHPSDQEIESHHYYNQVVLDVQRILKRFPPGIDEVTQSDLQIKVTSLIIRVLISLPKLHYYQGFHDVAITILLVLGEDLSYPVLCKLAETNFTTYMGPNMEPSMELLSLVYILIRRLKPDLYDFLTEAELGTMFCLPWVITWFGHVLNDYETVVRLYDVFLASPPEAGIYLSAAIVLERADEIFQLPREMPIIHHMLSQDLENLPFDNLILQMWRLMEIFPPDITVKAAKEFHAENQKRIKQEEEERRRLYALRKNKIPKKRRWTIADYLPVKSQTGRLIAVSVSIATLAWVYTYVRPVLYEI